MSDPFNDDTYTIPDAPRQVPPEEAHAEAVARGAKCPDCPLYGQRLGPVMGEIRPGSKLTIIGEAPGKEEVKTGLPFVGWSGRILAQGLGQASVGRAHATITNTILCKPPEGYSYNGFLEELKQLWERRARRAIAKGEPAPPPIITPTEACKYRLARDIQEAGSRLILGVGAHGLEAAAHHLGIPYGKQRVEVGETFCASLKKQHGAPIPLADGRVLIGTYHPAMAARGRKHYLPVIQDNIGRAALIATRGGRIDWSEPTFQLQPTVDEVERFAREALEAGAELTVDIETDGIDMYSCALRCVGVGFTIENGAAYPPTERVIVVPFRNMDGSKWWSNNEDSDRCARALRAIFDRLPLAGQNFSFDSTVMLRLRLMGDHTKPWTDTMLLHHDTPDNDLPHDLGFIMRRYFEAPLHKADVDHKSVNNVDNAALQEYNARDVLGTMRALKPLRAEIARWGTLPQYLTDQNLGPVLRNMGMLGLVVDEQRRGDFSGVLNWRCQKELYQLRKQIDKPNFNPRSVQQLQGLIFGEWGYTPVIGKDGFEIKKIIRDDSWKTDMLLEDDLEQRVEEPETGSTSSSALTELIKRRNLEDTHIEAIKTLLEYRAYDKLRGTYVDNLRVRTVPWNTHGMDVGYVDAVQAWVWDADTYSYQHKLCMPQRSALSLLNTTYKGHVTPTGRLSTQPAVQNWPALGKMNMREMVVAPPGHVLVGADYEQLEARLYAVAAGDELLLDAIRTGKDIHSMNAATLWARTLDEVPMWYDRINNAEKMVRKYYRTVAKRFAFLEIYGGEKEMLFSVMASLRKKDSGELEFPDLKIDDVLRWHENWHRLHPWTRMWHERCGAFCAEHRYAYVNDLDYRRRYFLGGVSKKNAVPNMSIQGWAASIANRALLRLVDKIPFWSWSRWTGVCLQVHDYIGMYVPENRAEEAAKILTDCMYYEKDGVPFPAEAGISYRWSKQD